MTSTVDFKKYKNVFCDSAEALDWAYKKGLNKNAMIRTSSPGMLWKANPKILDVTNSWNKGKIKKFISSTETYSKDIYDSVSHLKDISHEEALCIVRDMVRFDRILFKAACLEKKDLTESILFISLEGKGGSLGNRLNPPWEYLLKNNSKFKNVSFKIKDDEWDVLSTKKISIISRIFLAGYQVMSYKFFIGLTRFIKGIFSKKQVLIARENELIVDTASHLALKGVALKKIPSLVKNSEFKCSEKHLSNIYKIVIPIAQKRFNEWALPELNNVLCELLISKLESTLNIFYQSQDSFQKVIDKLQIKKKKTALIGNAMSTTLGYGMSKVFRENGIPVISIQHGGGIEYSHIDDIKSRFTRVDVNVADCMVVFNDAMKEVNESNFFALGKTFVSGISSRHLRMNRGLKSIFDNTPDIVFVSTNLYRGNIGPIASWMTDYERSLKEKKIIKSVLSKLPHKVRYKTYPEESRRYADIDPNYTEVLCHKNIELYDSKVDMRFLLKNHRVLISNGATSTISWLIFTNKPLVYIVFRDKGTFLDEAYDLFSQSLFLFYDDQYDQLVEFLSQSIKDIENQWKEKADARNKMIKKYFSSFEKGAGKRTAQMILDEYL